MDLYKEQIIDHYKHPRNWGKIDNPTKSHLEENPSCGDSISVDIVTENGKVSDMKFTGEGCAISIAATSLLSDEVIGHKIEEILGYDIDFIQELLGIELTTARKKCAMLGLQTIKKSLQTSH